MLFFRLKRNHKYFHKSLNKWVNPNNIISSTFNCCNGQGCMTCKSFKPINTFRSSTFGNDFIFKQSDYKFSCKTYNVVYLITCSSCLKQYVGETTQPLHKRINGHRSNVNAKSSTFIYEHFNLPGHCFADASIQIIDHVDSDMSNDVKNDLLLLEDYWIDKLGTAFPLGLNDKKKGAGNISQDRNVNYFCGQIARYKRGRGSKKKKKKKKSNDEVQSDINNLKDILTSFDHSVYKTLKCYSLSDLDTLYSLSQNNSGIIYNVCTSFCSTFSPKYQQTKSDSSKREFIVIPVSYTHLTLPTIE